MILIKQESLLAKNTIGRAIEKILRPMLKAPIYVYCLKQLDTGFIVICSSCQYQHTKGRDFSIDFITVLPISIDIQTFHRYYSQTDYQTKWQNSRIKVFFRVFVYFKPNYWAMLLAITKSTYKNAKKKYLKLCSSCSAFHTLLFTISHS